MSAINKVHPRKGNVTPIEFDSAKLKEKARRLHEFLKENTDSPFEAVGLLAFLLQGYRETLGIDDVVLAENPIQ